MTAYHLIPAAFLLMCVSAAMSYSERCKAAGWFVWASVGLGVCNCLLWATAARWTADRRELYSVSVAWDVAVIVAYSVLPLVALGVQLSPVAWAGFGMVCVGAILVKGG
jgi:hypothetical protein